MRRFLGCRVSQHLASAWCILSRTVTPIDTVAASRPNVSVPLGVALGLVALLVSSADAQRRRRTDLPPSVSAAQQLFETARQATADLVAVELTAGDANGEVRAWDRRWRRRLERMRGRAARLRRGCPEMGTTSCTQLAACAYLQGVPWRVLAARDLLFRVDDRLGRGHLAHQFAVDAARAEEALRRRRAGHTCEDVPGAYEAARLGVPQQYYSTGFDRTRAEDFLRRAGHAYEASQGSGGRQVSRDPTSTTALADLTERSRENDDLEVRGVRVLSSEDISATVAPFLPCPQTSDPFSARRCRENRPARRRALRDEVYVLGASGVLGRYDFRRHRFPITIYKATPLNGQPLGYATPTVPSRLDAARLWSGAGFPNSTIVARGHISFETDAEAEEWFDTLTADSASEERTIGVLLVVKFTRVWDVAHPRRAAHTRGQRFRGVAFHSYEWLAFRPDNHREVGHGIVRRSRDTRGMVETIRRHMWRRHETASAPAQQETGSMAAGDATRGGAPSSSRLPAAESADNGEEPAPDTPSPDEVSAEIPQTTSATVEGDPPAPSELVPETNRLRTRADAGSPNLSFPEPPRPHTFEEAQRRYRHRLSRCPDSDEVGELHATVTIREDGRVVSVIVEQNSHRELAACLSAEVMRWRLRRQSERTRVRVAFRFPTVR